MEELMDVVDGRDKVIGHATQADIYAKKLNHRIVHIFVIHPEKNEVYLQIRSEKKSYLPGFYCTSAGGHVRKGESYEEAAKRELKEELGLTVPIKSLHKMRFNLDSHDRFIELFAAFARDGISFDDGEVAGGRFFTLDEANKIIQKGENIHPQLSVCYNWLYANKDQIKTF